jgi:hypothetical protein
VVPVSAAWIIAVVVVVAAVAFLAGYWLRCEVELARRATGRTLDFSERRIGA